MIARSQRFDVRAAGSTAGRRPALCAAHPDPAPVATGFRQSRYNRLRTRESHVFRNIQGWDFIIILVVLLLLFGARKLPDLARSIGASAKEFRKGMEEGSTEDEEPPTEA
jgi:sec-independent protein translocase protein TatA